MSAVNVLMKENGSGRVCDGERAQKVEDNTTA